MTNVFVSYSHADTFLVVPVVKLLRVNKSLVFQDIDDIQPGKRWRDEIANALTTSDLVVVFWCKHASKSNEVKTEWEAAIKQEKDFCPSYWMLRLYHQSWSSISGLTFKE